MAAAGRKKVVSKDDLRRLMKEKGAGKTKGKRIESPLAKYNSLDQLVCVVCNSVVKSELLWNAHLQGRTHKENVERLKAKASQKSAPSTKTTPVPANTVKRKTEDNSGPPKKQLKGILKNSTASTPLGLGGYESSSEEEEDEGSNLQITPPIPGTSNSNLPSDFFDSGGTQSEPAEEEPKPQKISEKLPEGFFDDPVMDAKVREVQYKDKLEEEWELFQKAMKEEHTVSEQIQEEDDEQMTAERNMDEIDEQMHRWSKVNELEVKKEELVQQTDTRGQVNESGSEEEDEDFDEFLHWRSKEVWK